jgi:hypothetical protein
MHRSIGELNVRPAFHFRLGRAFPLFVSVARIPPQRQRKAR